MILRVADRRQLAGGTLSGTIASIHFGQGVSGGGSGTILEQGPADPPDSCVKGPGEFRVGVATAIASDCTDTDLKSKETLGA